MTGTQSFAALTRSMLVLLVLAASVATTAAQSSVIQARTPSRGGPAGGTTVEVIGNGWFGPTNTSVTMSGGSTQPTNVTVHSLTRLTFVTPPRPAVPTPYIITITSASIVRTAPFTYVARARSGVQGARKPVLSYTGQHVAFESRYALAANDTNGLVDIYVRNRNGGAVRRVSVASSGGQALGGESTSPAISATGRFIAFQSRATNLVPGDTNGLMDVFLHDRDADGDGLFDEAGAISTERINFGVFCSAACFAAQTLGGDSGDPAINGNGRYIAYQSAATNMQGDSNGWTDIFVFDRLQRLTRRVSTNFNQVQADGHSRNPAMSLSGRFVVFQSLANNLAGGLATVGTNPPVPASDIFLHDRDLDEDGVMDEASAIQTTLVSRNPCGSNLTNHSIEPSITYDGRFVVFATVAGNAKVDQSCAPDDFNGARDIFIWDRQIGSVTRRLSEGDSGELPGASGAPIISGNGSLLLFRTQAVNAGGGPSSPGLVIGAVTDDGKSTTGGVPSPTTDTPPPADLPPAPPTGSTEDPATSGDGNTTGNTTEPDPGTGGGEPVVELDETPEDSDGTPFISGLSPSSGPTVGGNSVEIQGANFVQGQTTINWNGTNFAPTTFVNGSLLRFTVPGSPGNVDGPGAVRVFVVGEASNEVEYAYATGLTSPAIISFATVPATNPVGGPVTGNTTVTISGFGFINPSVRFGGVAGNVTGSNATTITVTTPAVAVAGPVPIVVQNSNGTTAVSNSAFTYEFAAPVGAPSTAPLTPNRGPITGGTAITITGTQFTPTTTVTVGGVPATDLQVLSNTQIVAVTPAGAQGPADVVVTTANGNSTEAFTYDPLAAPILTCSGTDADLDAMEDGWELQYGLSPADGTDGALDSDGDGRTNTQECNELTHPRGLYTRYLAEGATGSFFDTRVVMANPGATPARVLFRFQTNLGQVVRHFLIIPATSRRTVDLRLLSGLESANISTVVESDVQVVADRTMRWDQVSRAGAHAESSSPAPSLTWYLAEGATHGTFDLFYLIQNPSPTQLAQVRIRYLLPAGPPIEQDITVAPNTRATVATAPAALCASNQAWPCGHHIERSARNETPLVDARRTDTAVEASAGFSSCTFSVVRLLGGST